MKLSRLSLSLLFIIYAVSGIPPEGEHPSHGQSGGEELLEKVRSTLWNPYGRRFTIQWRYSAGEEAWEGEGVLKILGKDYLRLTMPEQEVLIKKSTVMSWYRETDQVIIDEFDRGDPGNILSLLMGELTQFSVVQSQPVSDSAILLKLENRGVFGFDELNLSVDTEAWLPLFIRATAGEDVAVSIEVVDSEPLGNRDDLVNATLSGESVIDLRE